MIYHLTISPHLPHRNNPPNHLPIILPIQSIYPPIYILGRLIGDIENEKLMRGMSGSGFTSWAEAGGGEACYLGVEGMGVIGEVAGYYVVAF